LQGVANGHVVYVVGYYTSRLVAVGSVDIEVYSRITLLLGRVLTPFVIALDHQIKTPKSRVL
jgi:hypothetical protein